MKVSDFKLLATLPEEYDYELYNHNKNLLIVGRLGQHALIHYISNGKLSPISFQDYVENIDG